MQRVIVTTLFCEIVFLPLAFLWTGLGWRLVRLRTRQLSGNGNGFRRHPVVMTVYDRAETLSRSLRNLSLCEGLEDRGVWLFVDQLREGGHAISVIQVAESFYGRIPGLKIVLRDRNYGVPGNLVSGITEVVNREGAAIIFEDDVLVSRTFLSYMDEALTRYVDNKRIWCVNGFHHPLVRKSIFDRADQLYLSPRNMAWGFGIWADRWNAVDFDMTNWESLRDDLDRVGHDIIPLIEKQLRGDVHTWDVQCTVHMVKHGLMSVEPRRSLTKNIGFLGGFHKVIVNPILVHMPYYNLRPICEAHISADPRMLRKMQWMTFDPRLRVRVWRKFRRGLARLMPLNEEPAG